MRFIFLFIIFASSCANQSGNDKSIPNPFKENRAKEYLVYEYKYKFGEVDSSSKKLIEHFFYDTKGREVKRIFYGEGYEIASGYFPDTTIVVLDYSSYDQDRTLKVLRGKNSDSLKLSAKVLFDYKDRILEYVDYDKQGDVESKAITKWTGEKESTTASYDSYGNLTSRISESYSLFKSFDKDGQLIEEKTLVSEANNSKIVNIKDSSGTRKYVEKKTDVSLEWFIYDSLGNEDYSGKAKMSKGLILEKIFYSKGEPTRLVKYTYTYY